MNEKQRRDILKTHKPQQLFPAEPHLGAWYTEEEIEVATKAIRDSMDWRIRNFVFGSYFASFFKFSTAVGLSLISHNTLFFTFFNYLLAIFNPSSSKRLC